MDRRKEMRTDASAALQLSITESLRNLYLGILAYIFGDQEMSSVKPEILLNRMLSTKSAISTTSICTDKNQWARDGIGEKVFTTVGQGQCGTVYALRGTTMVIKLPNSPQKSDQLFNDFQIHSAVKNAFTSLPATMRTSYNINIPEVKMWVDPVASHFWSEHASMFPDTENSVDVPNYGLVTERIFPLPLPVRSAIVDTFCPKEIKKQKDKFLKMPENKDCLVRLYLGRYRKDSPMTPENVRLRNFPLHIDEMQYLKLDVEMFAKMIAQALAVLHWKVGVDANDIEFVLGSTPEISPAPSATEIQNAGKDTSAAYYVSDFKHRTVSMWLLDFNLCAKFSKDPSGLKKIVDGFWWNDPYYPRPSDKLWDVFVEHYLGISYEFNKTTMPKAFIDEVVEVGKKRAAGGLFA
ncbi:hypothetical protein BU26DRAFT_584940 [Trematosphaeria pertusa]|uniref:DUF3669 domain-containing protein n=1 Tax=Trematosphaeria pertusa TaxID=390896 RepID=A0A6A6HWU6_9PLEO|nr:uncharacterized protein BU26DRAFT_584940 [Trematosphaeria pertusa]KAF2242043.1 hypothetical protein BU26DRAFT_584940 [Trematosphaeria pertusa]